MTYFNGIFDILRYFYNTTQSHVSGFLRAQFSCNFIPLNYLQVYISISVWSLEAKRSTYELNKSLLNTISINYLIQTIDGQISAESVGTNLNFVALSCGLIYKPAKSTCLEGWGATKIVLLFCLSCQKGAAIHHVYFLVIFLHILFGL